jgi:YjbE family integral membrane protein
MDSGQTASWLMILLQILFLDLVLSGDNAAVIAMACRTLPKRDASKAIVLGAGGAILFRILLTSVAGLLILIPFLKLVSAFLLLVIAVNLTSAEPGGEAAPDVSAGPRGDIVAAALVIVTADAVMSLDNVVALAAITAGHFWLLALGLALSIPLLVVGSAALSLAIAHIPALVAFGGLLLGWTAGDLAATDPVYADWIAQQAPALGLALPISGAVFVWAQSRWIVAARRAKGFRPPQPKPAPAPAPAAAKPMRAKPAPAPRPVRVQPAAASMSSSALTEPAAAAEAPADDDLVMFLGLVGLFAVFGASIVYFLFFAG